MGYGAINRLFKAIMVPRALYMTFVLNKLIDACLLQKEKHHKHHKNSD